MHTPEFVTDAAAWRRVLDAMAAASSVAVDTESDSFYRYPEHLCLVQLFVDGRIFLVDPLALKDITAFNDVAGRPDVEKIFHEADYDLRCLDRETSCRMRGLFDTAVAIQLLRPTPLSLSNALKEYLGLTLDKSKKLQRADWSRRPLSPPLLAYAANDVAHLPALAAKLKEDLARLGRTAWAEEEFRLVEATRYEAPAPPEEAVFSMKGSSHLDPMALARLVALFVHRDREARQRGRPPFMVVNNEMLLHMAQQPHLAAKAFPRFSFPKLAPVTHPSRLRKSKNPWTAASSQRFTRLRGVRDAAAHRLGLAPHIVWPTRSLDRLALDPSTATEEFSGTSPHEVRAWQRTLLADALAAQLSP